MEKPKDISALCSVLSNVESGIKVISSDPMAQTVIPSS